MRLRTIGTAIILVALLAVNLLAQSPPPGKLNGTVVDTSDAVMPGEDGRFRIVNLPTGSYSVTFARAGFWMLRRENVILTNDLVTTLDAAMQVGGHRD